MLFWRFWTQYFRYNSILSSNNKLYAVFVILNDKLWMCSVILFDISLVVRTFLRGVYVSLRCFSVAAELLVLLQLDGRRRISAWINWRQDRMHVTATDRPTDLLVIVASSIATVSTHMGGRSPTHHSCTGLTIVTPCTPPVPATAPSSENITK